MTARLSSFCSVLGPGILAGALALGAAACGGPGGSREDGEARGRSAKGQRTLAIKVNVSDEEGFGGAFERARRAGNETFVLPMDWNELEVAPNFIEPQTNFLALADEYFAERDMPIHLSVRPIHTNRKVVPEDLMGIPLDDEECIERFERLLDWISFHVRNVEVASVVIGAEVDMYAFGDRDRWREWTRFYAAVAPYARKRFRGSLIASETTFAAFSEANLKSLRRLHKHGDAVGVSYYPMEPGLRQVRPPSAVHEDFAKVVDAVARKPVLFYQLGYPSSPALGSSLDQQAAFVREAFSAWDRHADRISMLQFQWMHEAPGFGIADYADYYDNHTPAFWEFLGSLGLRKRSGAPKPAWHVLGKEARARGFGAPP